MLRSAAFAFTALTSALLVGLSSATAEAQVQFTQGNETKESALKENATAENAVATWRLFTSEAGQFRIAMPSAPATYTFGRDANATDSRMHMQIQLVDASRLEIYAAAFIESTEFIQSEEDIDAALANCVNSLGTQSATAAGYQPLELGPYRGVEATFLNMDGGIQISRCYLAGDRAYLLSATGEPFSVGEALIPAPAARPTVDELLETAAPNNTPKVGFIAERSATMEIFFDSFEILDEIVD
ncbi:MAG: hypothetical protein AAFU53_08725 [Cyanobacteria bacterium J06632_3]